MPLARIYVITIECNFFPRACVPPTFEQTSVRSDALARERIFFLRSQTSSHIQPGGRRVAFFCLGKQNRRFCTTSLRSARAHSTNEGTRLGSRLQTCTNPPPKSARALPATKASTHAGSMNKIQRRREYRIIHTTLARVGCKL